MALVSYVPPECKTGEKTDCQDLVAYARFNIRESLIDSARLGFMKTIFTCALMTAGSLAFSSDTDSIIIAPITKMVSIIKQLADDPL
jgi:hypothetical protein